MRVLMTAAELFPYVKVGGLADVMGALPQALDALGADVRLLLPAYPALKDALPHLKPALEIPDLLGAGKARLLLGRTDEGTRIYLLDAPPLFDRPGGPYDDGLGDSQLRFGALSWASAHLARFGDGAGWKPQVLHAHDWQAALAPAYLALGGAPRPASVITIHNIAYQGSYPREVLETLSLPASSFSLEGVEFYGSLNFLKAGLAYADRITTVSPTYAREIQQPGGGRGMEGLLAHRSDRVSGILNGVDEGVWNPTCCPFLDSRYDLKHITARKPNKAALQREMGLDEDASAPLFGVISRLQEIKGLDMLPPNLDHLLALGAQLVVLGSGDPVLEAVFQEAAQLHPGRIAARIGYDEALSHRILAGVDVLLVPSREEPCGLTQLYAMRYGALPLVRCTGGLADTVVDTNPATLADGSATGFVFDAADAWVLGEALGRAAGLFRGDPAAWSQVQRQGMAQRFGWSASAKRYLELYKGLVK